jgi:CheY-like chemotaxis protein
MTGVMTGSKSGSAASPAAVSGLDANERESRRSTAGGRHRLLCVDDEPELLHSIRLNLRKRYKVSIAGSGPEALALFDEVDEGGGPPFDVVVSDMRMPGMSGAVFLTELRRRFPEVPRLLLSGQSDLDAAIAAINEAKIFRFLTKPCPPEILIESIDEALEQARLKSVERELLDQTLGGTVAVLTELLGLVSAGAYSRTMRVKEIVHELCRTLGRPVPWDLDLAAMLSQVGWVAFPDGGEVDADLDRKRVDLAAELVGNIPRLETVAAMVANQSSSVPRHEGDEVAAWPDHELDKEILRVAVLFDLEIAAGRSRSEAVAALGSVPHPPPNFLRVALGRLRTDRDSTVELQLVVDQLAPGMTLTTDLVLRTGPKLAGKGTVLTSELITRVRAFARSAGVVEPVGAMVLTSEAPKLQAG